MAGNINDILAGSNDHRLLDQLYMRIEGARNPAQRLFVDAWELSTFIASDGFEVLFEQERSLDEFAQVFVDEQTSGNLIAQFLRLGGGGRYAAKSLRLIFARRPSGW